MMDMRGEFLFLVLMTISCAHPASLSGPWRYERIDYSNYPTVRSENVADLAQRAQENFTSSPIAAHMRYLELVGAWRRPDGKMILAFSFGDSDSFAIYIFNARGEIIDRYVHSYWR
jgi:hypothetical protein